jgi:FdhD protein
MARFPDPASGALRRVLPQGEKVSSEAVGVRPSPREGERSRRPDEGSEIVPVHQIRNGQCAASKRSIAVETPVSLSYNGSSHAVMMASPVDLRDFAIGFSLTQGIVETVDEIDSIEIEEAGRGVDCRLWIAPERADALARKRRALAGPTGCGICGVEGIEEALRPVRRVELTLRPSRLMIMAAMASLAPAQALGMATRAVHAAGYWTARDGLVAIREDVGRHNALDKLAGALAVMAPRDDGLVLLTSRVSIEMVQKSAAIGASVLVAVSAPTSLAIETAEAAGIMLVGVARADGFEIFTFPERLKEDAADAA